jgi:PIN domain nuclease of toxin-antitoxin system
MSDTPWSRMTIIVNIAEAKAKLSALIEAAERGEQAIADPDAIVHRSPISVYQLELKVTAGKPPQLPGPLLDLVAQEGFIECPIAARHTDLAGRFALTH